MLPPEVSSLPLDADSARDRQNGRDDGLSERAGPPVSDGRRRRSEIY